MVPRPVHAVREGQCWLKVGQVAWLVTKLLTAKAPFALQTPPKEKYIGQNPDARAEKRTNERDIEKPPDFPSSAKRRSDLIDLRPLPFPESVRAIHSEPPSPPARHINVLLCLMCDHPARTLCSARHAQRRIQAKFRSFLVSLVQTPKDQTDNSCDRPDSGTQTLVRCRPAKWECCPRNPGSTDSLAGLGMKL